MTNQELEKFVMGVKTPVLDKKIIRTFVDKPVENPVAKPVAQSVAKPVAQSVAKPVAQSVAQVSWVAQGVAKQVAQSIPKKVAQDRLQRVAQDRPKRTKDSQELLIEKDVNRLKDQIFQIEGIDKRKSFVREVGWGIMTEKRGKKHYLFGVKKLGGRKYKLYIGNATG